MRRAVVLKSLLLAISLVIYIRRLLVVIDMPVSWSKGLSTVMVADTGGKKHIVRPEYFLNHLNDGQKQKWKQTRDDSFLPKWKETTTTTCGLWDMPDRPPEWPQPKIYYGITFGYELEILLVLLHEVYPAVDYIIIVESTITYTGLKKELNFEKNKKMFAPYLDKIRHIVMTQEDCNQLECRDYKFYEPWSHEHSQRISIGRGLYDADADDIVLVADTDEVVAREFLFALRRCMLLPSLYDKPLTQQEIEMSANPKIKLTPRTIDIGKCHRYSLQTVSFQHYFDCAATGHHWHPDLTSAHCVKNWTAERLRMWDERTSLSYKLGDLYKSRTLNYGVGWHMRSFLGVQQHSYKFKSYSETPHAKISIQQIKNAKKNCFAAESESEEQLADSHNLWFKFDSLQDAHLPHIIVDPDRSWTDMAHFVQYVDDDEEHSGFEAHQHNATR